MELARIKEIARRVSVALEAESQSHRAVPIIAYYFKELPALERAVVDAAIEWRKAECFGLAEPLISAADSLISAREKK